MADVVAGLRLIPQRYTPDAEVLQRLKAILTTIDAPLVVDLHTEATSQRVLAAGLGAPLVITVGQEPALRGARFHCYEFTQPLAQRLTDTTWQALLKAGQAQGELSEPLMHAEGRGGTQ